MRRGVVFIGNHFTGTDVRDCLCLGAFGAREMGRVRAIEMTRARRAILSALAGGWGAEENVFPSLPRPPQTSTCLSFVNLAPLLRSSED